MQIEIETSCYNERQYGKPYIAVMDFSKSGQGEPRWGEWIGQAGSAGLLVVDAEPGDIVMQGQKDRRNSRKSAPDYCQVANDGSLSPLATKAAAYKAFRDQQAAKPDFSGA